MPLWIRLFVLQKKLLQFFQTKDYKIEKILKDINFIPHLSYLQGWELTLKKVKK